eukprot:1161591-Pelagomonas_calceolata.AAC.10
MRKHNPAQSPPDFVGAEHQPRDSQAPATPAKLRSENDIHKHNPAQNPPDFVGAEASAETARHLRRLPCSLMPSCAQGVLHDARMHTARAVGSPGRAPGWHPDAVPQAA